MASMFTKIACVLVVCMVVFAPHAEAISCGQVLSSLFPCLGYLRAGGQPPVNCCNGVKALNKAAGTTADRKTACGCIKNSYRSYPGINQGNAGSLASKCGVSIPYKISPNTDCTRVQ